MADQLQVNDKIDIVVEDGPYQGKYMSKVAEINENSIRVTAPFNRGEIVPLHLNRPVKVFYTGNNAAYVFNTRVINRQNRPLALITLAKPTRKRRIQRRDYFRLEVKKKVKYRKVTEKKSVSENDGNNKDKPELKETMTIDISGGGVKLVADEDFPAEGKIEMYIDIPGIEDSAIIGDIVKSYDLPDGRAAGIEFDDIDHHDQEQIITWLFDYQRELRKRGLL